MKNYLFVCLGNICRSPIAEGVMRKLGQERGLAIQTDSAGTANYHVGESPDFRSIDVCNNHGLDISSQKGRQFVKGDFDKFDRIFVMDKSNYRNVISLASSMQEQKKVSLLMDIITPGIEVPDPYYGGPQGFENVYQMIEKACNKILDTEF